MTEGLIHTIKILSYLSNPSPPPDPITLRDTAVERVKCNPIAFAKIYVYPLELFTEPKKLYVHRGKEFEKIKNGVRLW